jgi:pimeloyl-ACP methyl ester carboxylesterase
MNSRRHLQRIARRLAAGMGDGASVVLVGHSAGAAAACPLAVDLAGRGVQVLGIVMVDGADSPNRLIERTLPDLSSVPITGVLAPPNPCNRQGRLAGLLELLDALHDALQWLIALLMVVSDPMEAFSCYSPRLLLEKTQKLGTGI